MKFSTIISFIASATVALAAPVAEPAPQAPAAPAAAPAAIDLTVLNFALTLEFLESTFYQQGLAKFDAAAFAAVGLPPFVRQQFQTIATHEATHVTTLQAVVAAKFGQNMAVPACTYNFQTALANVQNFVTFASILERTGVSAYDGAIHLIQAADIKTAGAAIATVEGRHSAFLNLLTGVNPAPGPFDTPLGIRPIVSIAAGLIAQCPFALPAAPFPALTIGVARPIVPGEAVPLGFVLPVAAGQTITQAAALHQCNWVFGIQQVRTAIQLVMINPATGAMTPFADGMPTTGVFPVCQVPMAIGTALFQQVVLFVVNQNRDVTLDDDMNVVAGPAVVNVKLA
ncbi:hypothetical protein HDU76_002483 [Blyttiomyces sp. JEL0837]|nr:hypothetical protein HDU76_002483 [Blyttiomyces sp. JEL0837]